MEERCERALHISARINVNLKSVPYDGETLIISRAAGQSSSLRPRTIWRGNTNGRGRSILTFVAVDATVSANVLKATGPTGRNEARSRHGSI